MDKYHAAQVLKEMGSILEMTDPYPKKGLAYRRASQVVLLMEEFEKNVKDKNLESFPGIGKVIASILTTLFYQKQHPYHEELMHKIPSTLFELMHIPGLGLSKLRILYETYHIQNFSDLEKLLQDETIKMKGFGPAFRRKILLQMEILKKEGHSLLYPQAQLLALNITDILKDVANRIDIGGSLRRKCELIHEIELLALSENSDLCLTTLCNHYIVQKVLKRDVSTATVLIKNSLKVHIRITNPKEWPYDLFKSTGNEDHVACIEKIAEYEKKRLKTKKSERELYTSLNMAFIPPELRENCGEIEGACEGKLPHLILEKDLKGAFHCHTTYSDGHSSLEEMVLGAKELGWEYIGIADHSKSSYQANGMNEERILNQLKEIQSLNSTFGKDFYIFSGVECDILKNGELDFSDEILKQLDYVIVSVHRFFNMEEEMMTKRILAAVENPYTTMIGHLTGRLLRFRNPYKLNIPKIIDACIANDKIIELNAYPSRLDMDWRYWIKAKDKGLKCSINPDAHGIHDLNNCQYGIHIARKGWLEKSDVINTLSLKEMKTYLLGRKPQ